MRCSGQWDSQGGAGKAGSCAQPWAAAAAAGQGCAHLAHRGAQAPGDLQAVLVHQESRDVLPAVALGHPDGGDGGQSGLLRNRETGSSPAAPADPGTAPGESTTEQGDFSLASKAAQAHLQLLRAVSSRCPHSLVVMVVMMVVVSLPCTHLLLHKELQPHVEQPLAQQGAVGPVSLPGALQTLKAERTGEVSAADSTSCHPGLLRAPRALLGLPCPPGATHQFCQQGQALPQAEEAVDGRCVVVPARGTRRGSAGLEHRSAVLMGTLRHSILPPHHPAQGRASSSSRGGGEAGLSPEAQAAPEPAQRLVGSAVCKGRAPPHLRGSPSQPQ